MSKFNTGDIVLITGKPIRALYEPGITNNYLDCEEYIDSIVTVIRPHSSNVSSYWVTPGTIDLTNVNKTMYIYDFDTVVLVHKDNLQAVFTI